MQRLFSHFPSALPGLGLLALRLVLTGFLLFDGFLLLDARGVVGAGWPAAAGAINIATALLLITCSAFVGIGLLTPITQLLVLVVQVAMLSGEWWAPASLVPIDAPWQGRVCLAAIALSLALTGPGAYSLDARLFGRREISFPPRARDRRS